jgi:AbrB family looped-hinge helix DNA binding protein
MAHSSNTLLGKNYADRMRITSKGQVTIPQHIRESYGFMPETEVDFIERDGAVVLEAADGSHPDAADRFVAKLPGSASGGLSTDEIMKLTRDYDLDD